jgi:hypothetical protein
VEVIATSASQPPGSGSATRRVGVNTSAVTVVAVAFATAAAWVMRSICTSASGSVIDPAVAAHVAIEINVWKRFITI